MEWSPVGGPEEEPPVRIPISLALAALTAVLAACRVSGPNDLPTADLPGLSCADDECPPTDPIHRPGHQVPIYEIVQEPIWEERRTPVWGEKTVPVYQTRRVPVHLTVWDPCSGCDKELELWDKEKQVQVGVQRVRACIGYKTQRVRVGSCPKKVIVGWRAVEETPPCP